MSRAKTIIFTALVFVATIGVYFYVRHHDADKRKIEQEYGNPDTSGFREFFLADAVLTDPKQDACLGNNSRSVDVAELLQRESVTVISNHVELPASKDPLQISQPRAYVLLRGKYCMFLVYVPELATLSEASQLELAAELWSRVQPLAAAEVQGYPTVGLGLRGHRLFGPIMVGGKEGEPLLTQDGGRYVFYPYFEGDPALQVADPVVAGKGNSVMRPAKAE